MCRGKMFIFFHFVLLFVTVKMTVICSTYKVFNNYLFNKNNKYLFYDSFTVHYILYFCLIYFTSYLSEVYIRTEKDAMYLDLMFHWHHFSPVS